MRFIYIGLLMLLPVAALAQGLTNAAAPAAISYTSNVLNVYYRSDVKIWLGTNMYLSALGTQTNLFKVTITPAWTGAVTAGAQ